MKLDKSQDPNYQIYTDNKIYYNQTLVKSHSGALYNWIDIERTPNLVRAYVYNDLHLRMNYKKATVVDLKFDFPFYGHILRTIVVATGGFVYTGDVKNYLSTDSQYIAPLMANFDPTLNTRTSIKYVDNSTHFICTWENLVLKDQPENGEYTFQAVLINTGEIIFNYKKVPKQPISDFNHDVKIGLSDAYLENNYLSKCKPFNNQIDF